MALLVRDGMGGFNGFTTADYERLTDWQIVEVYFAERTKKGRLITERRQEARRREKEDGRQAPAALDLEIPPECFRRGVQASYVRLLFELWAKRGLNEEQRAEKWRQFRQARKARKREAAAILAAQER